jgi:hypothetical protein
VRTFGTTTSELFALGDWLESHGCTHIAMDATGVYWKPIWHMLEGLSGRKNSIRASRCPFFLRRRGSRRDGKA